MKRLFLYLPALILVSCSDVQSQISTEDTIDTSTIVLPVAATETAKVVHGQLAEPITEEEGETVRCYVVIADTGMFYDPLKDYMLVLHDTLKQAIDTMGRTYNNAKDLIALPDDDEDELYAGDYYPRRFPSEDLSLEYLSFYKVQAKEKSIALVTGIYETKSSADSALSILKKGCPTAFIVQSDIYMGCIH